MKINCGDLLISFLVSLLLFILSFVIIMSVLLTVSTFGLLGGVYILAGFLVVGIVTALIYRIIN